MQEFILDAKRYFTEEQWHKFDESKQMQLGKICYIYYACVHLGIHIVAPDFMMKRELVDKEMPICNRSNQFENSRTIFILEKDKKEHMKGTKKRLDTAKKHFRKKYNVNAIIKDISRGESTDSEKNLFVCNICKKAFAQKENLNAHIKSVHLSVTKELFSCNKCSFTTNFKNNLKIHKKIHTGKKIFECKTCNMAFLHKNELALHNFKHNCQIFCDICKEDFPSNKQLGLHMNKVHGVKRLKCQLCEYSTNFDFKLKMHSYRHLKNKPLKCYICAYQCTLKKQLENHIAKKHK